MFPLVLCGQYSITGQLQGWGDWKYVHLQYVPSLDKLPVANTNHIIQTATIDSAGHFEIKGIGLPEGERLYMLLLDKESEGVTIMSGPFANNYLYLIMKEPAQIELHCPDVSHTFSLCTIGHSPQSTVLNRLTGHIIPSLFDQFITEGTPPNEIRKEFFYKKMNRELKAFADTCQYDLPALVALRKTYNLEDDYKNDPVYYENFLQRLEPVRERLPYAREFELLIGQYHRMFFGEEKDRRIRLFPFVVLLSVLLLAYVIYLKKQLHTYKKQLAKTAPDNKTLNVLSSKERQVFELLVEGKSNKEIAQALFIETSTVKTHINKIYQKLGIRTRKEALKWRNT